VAHASRPDSNGMGTGALRFTISNGGNDALTVSGIALSDGLGSFTEVDWSGGRVAPGGSS